MVLVLNIFTIFLSCVVCVFGYPWAMLTDPRAMNLPVCPSHNPPQPCKIIFAGSQSSRYHLISHTPDQICTCPGQQECPTRYGEDLDRTLAFSTNIDGRQSMVEYKFCEPIVEDRLCVGEEVAATLQGNRLMPQKLLKKPCKCGDEQQMQLKQVTPKGFKVTQDFVCSLPACQQNRSQRQRCMVLQTSQYSRSQKWEYECACSEGLVCSINPIDIMTSGDQPIAGYCRVS